MTIKPKPTPLAGSRAQRGAVLLMALIALLLIAAVAAAILFTASGESALVGNQRTSIRALYAAAAGIEEARARLLDYHPNAFAKVSPPLSLPSAVGQVVYIVNPAAGEVVNPTDLSASNPYADLEYEQEFGTPVTTATSVRTIPSAQPVVAGVTAIPYKWVRITVKTERAANADINGDVVLNNIIPVYHDGKRENLTNSGQRIYRVAALAVLPGGARHMAEADVVPVPAGGFDYALAAGNACQLQTTAPITINGNIRCNSEIIVDGHLTLVDGDMESYTVVNGSGSVTLNSTHQVRANGEITPSVAGGGSPNTVSAPGTVQQLLTPATPTPSPLAPNTMPNPNALNITSTNKVVNPPGVCIGGKLVFNLLTLDPPMLFEFDNAAPKPPTWAACGASNIPSNFPANVQFQGKGTIYFSQNHSIDFRNDFGTIGQALELNIIARPKDNSVGQDTISFFGKIIHIRGLIYTHGEVYTKCPPPPGNQMFHVYGSVLAYKDPNQLGPTDNGDFGVGNCTNNLKIQYDPAQLASNPPPGFDGLLTGSPGGGGSKVSTWREVF